MSAAVDLGESAERRRFLAHVAQVTMDVEFADGSGTWRAARTPERIGLTDVRQVQAASRAFWELDRQYGDGRCQDAFLAELSWAEGLQRAEATDFVKKELALAIANLRVLAKLQWGGIDQEASVPVEPRRPVARASQRAVKWAARIVPALERERYFDEYLSELDDLAQRSHPRRAQLLYVLRLFIRLPALRFALRGDGETRELAR